MHNQAFFRSPTQLFTRPHITGCENNSHRNITMTLSLKQWSCVLCGERMKLEVFKSCVLSGFFAPCKEIQDSFGVLIPCRGFRIPVTGFQALKHGFWFSIVSGIPDSLSYIPDIKAQDFGYHKHNFSRIPESTSNKFREFWNPDSLHVASFLSSRISESGFLTCGEFFKFSNLHSTRAYESRNALAFMRFYIAREKEKNC